MSNDHDAERYGDLLDGVITAIARTVGPCRFESATLRSSGLVVPAIWGASSAWWAARYE